MRFLDGVYTEHADGHLRFHPVAAPTDEELSLLVHTRARRIGRHLERHGLLQRDVENDYLSEHAFEAVALMPAGRGKGSVAAVAHEDGATLAWNAAEGQASDLVDDDWG